MTAGVAGWSAARRRYAAPLETAAGEGHAARDRHRPLSQRQLCLSPPRRGDRRGGAGGRAGGGADRGGAEGAGLGARPHPDHPPPRRPYRRGGGASGGTARRSRAPRRTAARLPALDVALEDGRHGRAGRERGARSSRCRGTRSGTSPTISPEAKALFSADSLMVMGCGRLFEGTPEQMWASLMHAGGAAGRDAGLFRARVRREQRPLRALGRSRRTPALQRSGRRRSRRCGRWAARRCRRGWTWSGRRTRSCGRRMPDFKARLGLENLPDAQVFAEVRRRKDAF